MNSLLWRCLSQIQGCPSPWPLWPCVVSFSANVSITHGGTGAFYLNSGSGSDCWHQGCLGQKVQPGTTPDLTLQHRCSKLAPQLRPDCLPGVSGPRSHEQGPPDMVSPVSLDFPGGQAGLLLLSPNSPHSCKLSCSCASQPGESLSQTSPPIPLLPHITCSEGPFQVCLALSALSPSPLFCPHLTSTAVNFLNGGTRNLQPPILQRL